MTFGNSAFTLFVKSLQELYGSRMQFARVGKSAASQDHLTQSEKEFLAGRDMFYWVTVGSTGWPYVQHRGGPKGFMKVIDDRTLAFTDFRGNRQYIKTGNLMSDDRVAMILVDYPRQARLKILGDVEIFGGPEADGCFPRVRVPGYRAVIKRVFVIHIEAYGWNFPQHVTPRHRVEELQGAAHAIEERSSLLEKKNETLRKELARLRSGT